MHIASGNKKWYKRPRKQHRVKEKGALGNRRVALKPHASKIRQWVEEGRGDTWIAQELNTTPSSVQSFRSRNSIYRRDPVRRGQLSEHPAVLEETEGGIVLKTDATDSEVFDREWRHYLRGSPEDLQVVITQDRIYLEKVRSLAHRSPRRVAAPSGGSRSTARASGAPSRKRGTRPVPRTLLQAPGLAYARHKGRQRSHGTYSRPGARSGQP